MQRVVHKIIAALGSRRFYWGVMGFFVAEALWVAFSALYPMAFDEQFHFGVIQMYSQHWLPFLGGQPDGADAFGALAADPSYLYHYVMSFPYRFISLLTDNLAAQVICLRIINVALFGAGLVLMRKVLLRAGTSPALAHTALLLFVLVPTVPLLAGQINYDNALLPLLAWICLLVFTLAIKLRARQVDLKTFGLLGIACLLTSVVKYAFLPIVAAAGLFVVAAAGREFYGQGRQLGAAVQKSYRQLGRNVKLGLLAGLIIASALFAQRYGLNTINYGTPLPPCEVVIGVDACSSFAPWARNQLYAQTKGDFNRNPLAFTWTWLQGLHYRLFFMINGPPAYTNYPPAPLPSAMAVVIGLFGLLSVIFYWRRVFAGQPQVVFLALLLVVYAVVLWFENYTQFLETGQPVAVNGRYLIPMLLPLAAVLGRGLSVGLRRWPVIKAGAVAVAIVLFIQGGGIFSFILRSDESWYWPNQAVAKANNTAQQILDPIMYEGRKWY